MRIHTLALSTLACVIAIPVISAQQPAREPKLFISAADVVALQAKAKNDRATTKKDAPIINNNLLLLPPYSANLEYRASVGPASSHFKEAEMFYVVDGSGVLVTGGKIANEKPQGADNATGTGIDGGQSQKVAKGDFIMVPPNTPHWFSQIDGVLVLMSLHLPTPAK